MADLWGEEEDDDQQDQDMEEEEEDILDTGEDTAQQQDDALLMRFCPHDSSMLYPQVCSKRECFILRSVIDKENTLTSL